MKKTALAIAIANRERDILKDIDYKRGYSLYVGIPLLPKYLFILFFQFLPSGKMEGPGRGLSHRTVKRAGFHLPGYEGTGR